MADSEKKAIRKKNREKLFLGIWAGFFFVCFCIVTFTSISKEDKHDLALDNSKKPQVLGIDNVWTQTDWSGGISATTPITTDVTTYASAENIKTPSGQIEIDDMDRKGIFTGNQNTSGTNFNITPQEALVYNTNQEYDSRSFSYDSGEPTKITVLEDGDYFLSLTMPFLNSTLNSSYRYAVEAEIQVNGIKADVGVTRSSYTRTSNSNDEASDHLGVMLYDLSANDYIEIFARGYATLTETYTGDFTLYTEKVESSTPVFTAKTTRTVAGTNVNSSESPLQWIEEREDSKYQHDDGASSHNITINDPGKYFITVNIPIMSTVQRANLIGLIKVNGTEVQGGKFQNGYLRSYDGHNQSSLHWSGIVETTGSNSILTVSVQIGAATGTVNIGTSFQGDESGTIYIEQLTPDDKIYIGESTQLISGTNWNPTSASQAMWETDTAIDSSVYSHDTGSDSQEITVLEDGDYLLSFNANFTSTVQRAAPKAFIQVNGSDVTGAMSATGYIRSQSGHNSSSDNLLIPLKNLSKDDVISVNLIAEAATGTVTLEEPAVLMLWQKGYFPSATLTSQIYNTGNPSDWDVANFTTSGTGTVNVRVRTDSNADMSTAPNFSTCDPITDGWVLAVNNCVTDGQQYIQYQIELISQDGKTPALNDLTINSAASDVAPPTANMTDVIISGHSDGDWLKTKPTISWTEGHDDLPDGIGLEGYCLAIDEVQITDPENDPSSSSLDPGLTGGILNGINDGIDNAACSYIVSGSSVNLSSISGLNIRSGYMYFLSAKAVDLVQNIWTGASNEYQDLISFKFDNTAPSAPSFMSLPGNFVSTKDVTFTWPTSGGGGPSDAHSGLLGVQYRIGQSGTWYGDLHLGTQDSQDLLVADGSYTMDPAYDYPALVEGNNLVYMRAIDNAGNVSTNIISGALKLNTLAPSEVQNLAVSPETNTTNAYTFNWDIPTTYSGQASNLTYCYTINVLPTSSNCTFTAAGQTDLDADAYATQPGLNTFYIIAKDEAGNLNYDYYASINFTYSGSAPGIPRSLDIADISIKSSEKWRLALTWDNPANIGAGVASYKVYRSAEDASCSSQYSDFSQIATTSGNSYIDTDLEQQDYYYCVKACDSANSCSAVSSTVTEFPTGKFTEPPNLASNPEVGTVTTSRAVITWATDREADTKVAYGTASNEYLTDEAYRSAQEIVHSIILNNLKPNTTYFFRAKWTDEDGNTGVSQEYSFKTDPPPIIDDVEVTSITTRSATIRFKSTGATKVNLYYGITNSFGALEEYPTSTQESEYSIQLANLQDGTKYFFKLNPFDIESEEYEGTVLSFTTVPNPQISNITIEEVKLSAQPTVKVNWETNTETYSALSYAPSSDPTASKKITDLDYKTAHEAQITNLSANTAYLLIITATDRLGNSVSSTQQNFTTATDSRPPEISNVKVESNVLEAQDVNDEPTAQLIISWDTDEPASGYVEYGEGSGDSYSQRVQEEGNGEADHNNHVISIPNLTPSKVYHLRAVSADAAGNEAFSQDIVTLTPKANDSVFKILFGTLSNVFSFLK